MKPNEDYAGLIARLRKVEPDLPGDRTRWHRNPDGPDAADALEAVLAERDALKDILPNQNHEGRAPIPTDWWGVAVLERRKRRAAEKERDALLARLAPVDDEALETIAARAIVKENVYKETQIPSKTLARAAIAAIRPHIEAAERERCAQIADKYEGEWHSDTADACARTIAAAIRSGK